MDTEVNTGSIFLVLHLNNSLGFGGKDLDSGAKGAKSFFANNTLFEGNSRLDDKGEAQPTQPISVREETLKSYKIEESEGLEVLAKKRQIIAFQALSDASKEKELNSKYLIELDESFFKGLFMALRVFEKSQDLHKKEIQDIVSIFLQAANNTLLNSSIDLVKLGAVISECDDYSHNDEPFGNSYRFHSLELPAFAGLLSEIYSTYLQSESESKKVNGHAFYLFANLIREESIDSKYMPYSFIGKTYKEVVTELYTLASTKGESSLAKKALEELERAEEGWGENTIQQSTQTNSSFYNRIYGSWDDDDDF